MNPDIAIVVIGYNRPSSLDRLLGSLAQGLYMQQKVTLYISIDGIKKGAEGTSSKVIETRRIAGEFNWQFGDKRIILHDQNLGLREHVLTCGDLSSGHDALIVLEDDLVVSEAFYDYALQAYHFYKDDLKIGGFSLYHHAYNETAQFPFIPLADGSDVYFLQYASSWGQMWTKAQWHSFREWYRSAADKPVSEKILPPNIRLWPENSWKKFFIEYLVVSGRYFIFPRSSHTTIFGDEGTNIRIRETFLQVPLWHGKREYRFIPIEESSAVYDTYCEILPDRLKRLMKDLQDEDFEVDLYGMKPPESISKNKIISGRRCKSPERLFGREMKPHEENLVSHVPGNYFSLGNKSDFENLPYLTRLLKCHEKRELSYWYPIREYHFYENRLLATERKSSPFFLFKKILTTARYAFRYFKKS